MRVPTGNNGVTKMDVTRESKSNTVAPKCAFLIPCACFLFPLFSLV